MTIATAPSVDLRAQRLGVTPRALELLDHFTVVDLHIDTFIPPRLWGYDVLRDHGKGPLLGRFFGHLDVPRLKLGGVDAAMWSITTNPFRTAASRWQVFRNNLAHLTRLVERSAGQLRFATTAAEVRTIREQGAHAVLLSVQGGNAFEAADLDQALADPRLTRVTLVHLTDSGFGPTSSPLSWQRGRGLSEAGRKFVQALNKHRVFVDLAHIAPRGFWDAVEVHDRTQPLIATHTGVSGVTPHWRNLDDQQIRAIADTGGVVGIIVAAGFLRRPGGPRDVGMMIEHLQHVIDVAGDTVAAIGTDYDGAIVPPPDLRDGLGYARLVQAMLDRGWSDERIDRVLGGNALRALEKLRP